MTTVNSATLSLRSAGRLAWAALWWVIALGGCITLLAAWLSTLMS